MKIALIPPTFVAVGTLLSVTAATADTHKSSVAMKISSSSEAVYKKDMSKLKVKESLAKTRQEHLKQDREKQS